MLTDEFAAHPLQFMKKYAICPVNDIEGYRGKAVKDLDTSAIPVVGKSTGRKSVKYSRVMRSKKIGYIEMFEDTGRTNDVRNDEGAGVIRFNASYTADPARLPVYFLPWNSDGAIVRMTIPPKGGHNPDPDIFFTAAINGCSVFVQGTPGNPTLYHAGGDTGRSDPNDAARFWQQALANYIGTSESAQDRGAIGGEVNKTHYVKTPGTIGNSTTPRAQEYEDYLKSELDKKGKFSVTMVNPWGCVMGIRTDDDWAFYLQENATVICEVITKHLFSKAVRTRVKYARPMAIRKIFPGGGAVADMRMKVPVSLN